MALKWFFIALTLLGLAVLALSTLSAPIKGFVLAGIAGWQMGQWCGFIAAWFVNNYWR